MENPYVVIMVLCALVVISYFFTILSSSLRIPSVILLIGAGIGLGFAGKAFGFDLNEQPVVLEILGIVGLILIVLEGALDLSLTRKKIPLIRRSLIAALLMLLFCTAIIAFIFVQLLGFETKIALIYAVPLGVVSSSIAIPSVERLPAEKREFIIYESTFSDILGIMLFNYVILEDPLSSASIGGFFWGLLLILLISAVSSLILLYLLNHARTKVKFFLVFAILMLVYSAAKLFHLPALLLILVFGVMMNNASLFVKGKLANHLHVEKLQSVTHELRQITEESAFLIRTFFFLLFGYSIELLLLKSAEVVLIGSLIIVTILITRFVFLRFVSKTNVFPELFVAPRGLITIVLFYSIPPGYRSENFNEGILFFVIIVSSLIMMFGLMKSGAVKRDGLNGTLLE